VTSRRGEAGAGEGIEPAPQIPHPLGVDPRRHSRRSTLPLQAVHAVVGLQAGGFEFDSTSELVHRCRGSNIAELIDPLEQFLALARFELLRGAGHGVDVIGGDRPVLQGLGQLRSRRQCR
jgi:hypothetical protein